MALSTTSPTGRRERASADLRDRLVESAVVEFAAHGFDGASTRAIAARADAHQPQINYHFDSKESLWRVVIGTLLAELDEMLAEAQDELDDDASLRDRAAALIRGLVRFSAARPELNRIMIHEGTASGDRLAWLVETQLRDRAVPLLELWDDLRARGEAAPVPSPLVYHLLLGAATLLHANAPEARLLFGVEPADPGVVDDQADALVAMFLPPAPASDS